MKLPQELQVRKEELSVAIVKSADYRDDVDHQVCHIYAYLFYFQIFFFKENGYSNRGTSKLYTFVFLRYVRLVTDFYTVTLKCAFSRFMVDSLVTTENSITVEYVYAILVLHSITRVSDCVEYDYPKSLGNSLSVFNVHIMLINVH